MTRLVGAVARASALATSGPHVAGGQTAAASRALRLARRGNGHLASPSDVLALQRAAGNRAVTRVLARAPKHKAPEWLTTTAKDRMPGEPVPGYETTRAHYTDDDREAFTEALTARRIENERTVEDFLGEWSAALVELWGKSLTEAMAKAASHSTLTFWGELVKFIIKESVIALTTEGAGLAWKALELGEEELPLFAEKATGLAIDLAADKVKEEVTGSEVDPKVESTKEKLDAKTATLAAMVKKLRTDEILDTPWERYAAWLGAARLGDLGRFRLPPKLPPIPKAEIRRSVAGAIVGAIHDPHLHDEIPGRQIPGTGGDWTHTDPTGDDPISFFDDNVAIVHLTMGGGHQLVNGDAEIYTPSKVLLDVLVGQQLRQMPGVPLFITIDPRQDADWHAANELIGALRKASPGVLPAEDPDADDPDADERAAFVKAYPHDEKEEMRVIRYFRDDGEHLAGSGGGLAEQLWLYRWATGDDLSGLATEILREVEIKGIESTEKQAKRESTGSSTPSGSSSPAELAAITASKLDQHWTDKDRGMKRLITQYVLGLTAGSPEDRWSAYYWSGTRYRLFHRDPVMLQVGTNERKSMYGQ